MRIDEGLRAIAGVFVVATVALGVWVNPVVVRVHRIRGAEPVAERVLEVVPDDGGAQAGRAAPVKHARAFALALLFPLASHAATASAGLAVARSVPAGTPKSDGQGAGPAGGFRSGDGAAGRGDGIAPARCPAWPRAASRPSAHLSSRSPRLATGWCIDMRTADEPRGFDEAAAAKKLPASSTWCFP